MSNIRCCILGATGFIGGQIARAAIASGLQVRGMRRRPDATGAVQDLDIEWVTGDLTDPASLVTSMRGCPLVFHAAGYYPRRARNVQAAMRHGVTGMRNFLNAAVTAGVKRIVYTSSTSTIGPPGNPNRLANENDCYTPGSAISPYYDVKWAMETEAMRAVVQGVQVITVLPTVVFGPGDVKPTTSAVLLTVARGYVPVYFNATTNFVDGRDVATGHIAAAKRGKPGQRYIIGGHNLTIQEMLSIAAKAAGRKPPQLGLPMWLLRIAARIGGTLSIPAIHHLQAIDHWQALDTGKTKQELALANPIPFEQTCQDTLQWFHEHGYLKSPPAQATQASGSTQ